MKRFFQKSGNRSGAATKYAPLVSMVAPRVVGDDKPVDIKLGAALLKDGRVAVGTKLMALVGGIAGVAVIDTLELPLEMLLAVLLPFVGMGINLAFDGVEYIAGSLLLAAAILPHIAPKELVARIRQERRGPVTVSVEK